MFTNKSQSNYDLTNFYEKLNKFLKETIPVNNLCSGLTAKQLMSYFLEIDDQELYLIEERDFKEKELLNSSDFVVAAIDFEKQGEACLGLFSTKQLNFENNIINETTTQLKNLLRADNALFILKYEFDYLFKAYSLLLINQTDNKETNYFYIDDSDYEHISKIVKMSFYVANKISVQRQFCEQFKRCKKLYLSNANAVDEVKDFEPKCILVVYGKHEVDIFQHDYIDEYNHEQFKNKKDIKLIYLDRELEIYDSTDDEVTSLNIIDKLLKRYEITF